MKCFLRLVPRMARRKAEQAAPDYIKTCADEIHQEEILLLDSRGRNEEYNDLYEATSIDELNNMYIWFQVGKHGHCGLVVLKVSKEHSPDKKWEFQYASYDATNGYRKQGVANPDEVELTVYEAFDIAKKAYKDKRGEELDYFVVVKMGSPKEQQFAPKEVLASLQPVYCFHQEFERVGVYLLGLLVEKFISSTLDSGSINNTASYYIMAFLTY